MSICAEGTVALPSQTQLLERFKKIVKDDFYITESRYVLTKGKYEVFTLEMRGHSEELCSWITANGGIYEINYLDGEPPYTVTSKGESKYQLKNILRLKFKQRKKLRYSCEF